MDDYKQAQQVLLQYGNLDSFKGIREDCEKTLIELRNKLHRQLTSVDVIDNYFYTSDLQKREIHYFFLRYQPKN